jgi:HSP20 family protein
MSRNLSVSSSSPSRPLPHPSALAEPLVRWPASFQHLREEMDRMLEGFFRDAVPSRASNAGLALFSPSADVCETEDEVEVTCDLPGVAEKDIEVSYNAGQLTIKAKTESQQEKKDKQYYMMERSLGQYQRTVSVAADIDEKGIRANAKNGVLTVTLPKTKAAKEQVRKIPVSSG